MITADGSSSEVSWLHPSNELAPTLATGHWIDIDWIELKFFIKDGGIASFSIRAAPRIVNDARFENFVIKDSRSAALYAPVFKTRDVTDAGARDDWRTASSIVADSLSTEFTEIRIKFPARLIPHQYPSFASSPSTSVDSS
jgi:hypothetical protein